jgi:hypothetical protein
MPGGELWRPPRGFLLDSFVLRLSKDFLGVRLRVLD